MRTTEVVRTAVKEISGQLKEIKDADEDDLSKLAQSFDAIGTRADKAASTLARADEALGGGGGEDGEQGDDEPEQPDAGGEEGEDGEGGAEAGRAKQKET